MAAAAAVEVEVVVEVGVVAVVVAPAAVVAVVAVVAVLAVAVVLLLVVVVLQRNIRTIRNSEGLSFYSGSCWLLSQERRKGLNSPACWPGQEAPADASTAVLPTLPNVHVMTTAAPRYHTMTVGLGTTIFSLRKWLEYLVEISTVVRKRLSANYVAASSLPCGVLSLPADSVGDLSYSQQTA